MTHAEIKALVERLETYRSRNEWGDPVHHTICDEAATALRSFMDGGWRLVPVEPTDGLLMSMAMRWDHGLGCPGYYDQPFFAGQPTHAQRLDAALSRMRQLHEEVVGSGFYSADREDFYLERLPTPPAVEGEAGE